MDYCELEASAETELREAILSEFLKPELPAPITLLRHCERYTVRIFDAQVERLFDRGWRPDFWRCLRNVMESLLVYFFGCPYEPPGAAHVTRGSLGGKQAMIGGTRVAPGCPWGRCIEYAMLGRVDHGPEPRPGEDEVLGRYLDINGHFFLTYALQTRVDFWHSKAKSAYLTRKGAAEGGFPTANQAGATEPSGGEPTRTEAERAVNAAILDSKGQGRRRGPKPDYETAGRVADIARVAPDGDSRSMLDEVCDAAPKKTLEWEGIEFSFIGDHDAEMRIADTQARKVNYKEIAGFEDRRTGKPSQLWAMLRVFGSLPDGTMPDDARTGKEWEAIRKKIERTSKALRKHFGMTGDPFPYIRGTGYRARIKIRPAPDSSR